VFVFVYVYVWVFGGGNVDKCALAHFRGKALRWADPTTGGEGRLPEHSGQIMPGS